MGTRDDMCGIDVARMAELGGFAEEITIIGCVYKQDGDVLYRVTDDPDEAYRFYESAARQGILPTLPQIYVRREIIPAGQRERMTDEAKLTCARQMRDAFDAASGNASMRLLPLRQKTAPPIFWNATGKIWKGATRGSRSIFSASFLTKRSSVIDYRQKPMPILPAGWKKTTKKWPTTGSSRNNTSAPSTALRLIKIQRASTCA